MVSASVTLTGVTDVDTGAVTVAASAVLVGVVGLPPQPASVVAATVARRARCSLILARDYAPDLTEVLRQ
jgi:hypothetical protein